MIIYEFKSGQGLGNQLWCYFSLLNISKELDIKFMHLNFHEFKAKHFINLHSKEFTGDLENIQTLKETLFYDKENKYFSSDFDFCLINFLKKNKDIDFKIEGLFQSEKYFFNNNISKQVKLNFKHKIKKIDYKSTCIINIRGGEYKKYKLFNLKKNYWLKNITYMEKSYGINNFKIVTDDASYTKNLLPEIETLELNIEQCFNVLFNSKYIITSNSTFAYMPLKLSSVEKKVIISPAFHARPYVNYGRWCSPSNIYDGFKYFDCVKEIFLKKEEINKLRQSTLVYYKSNLNIKINYKTSKNYPRLIIKHLFGRILKTLFPMKF